MVDPEYKKLILNCLNGEEIQSRNSLCFRAEDEISVKFDTTPLVSSRKTCWKLALREWEWFMSGSNKLKDLHPSVLSWWEPWQSQGEVWRNYSCQFRNFAGHESTVDSIDIFINGIKYNPFSRRNVITTWNTADMNNEKCPITNCHGTVIQALVSKDKKLTIKTYQRSADVICGVPHNWIQYWAFLLWVCHLTDTKPGSLIWIGGDVHIYEEHKDLAIKICRTAPSEQSKDKEKDKESQKTSTPNLIYKGTSKRFLADDFSLDGPYDYILNEKAKMVV